MMKFKLIDKKEHEYYFPAGFFDSIVTRVAYNNYSLVYLADYPDRSNKRHPTSILLNHLEKIEPITHTLEETVAQIKADSLRCKVEDRNQEDDMQEYLDGIYSL